MAKDAEGNDIPDESGVIPDGTEDLSPSKDVPDESGVIPDKGGEDNTDPAVKLKMKKLRDARDVSEDENLSLRDQNRELQDRLNAKDTPELEAAPKDLSKEPNYDDYEDVGQYHKDMARWGRQAIDAEDAAAEEVTVQEKVKTDFNDGITAAKEKHEDYAQVARIAGRYSTDEMVEQVMQSENAHDIVYYLGQNPKEAQAMARMNPLNLARAFGRLDAKFVSADAGEPNPDELDQKKITNAGEPAADLPGGGTDVPGGGETAAEYAIKRRAARAALRDGKGPAPQADSREARRASAVKTS